MKTITHEAQGPTYQREAEAHRRVTPTPGTKPRRKRAGFGLGHLAGIELRIDWSLLFIFLLVAFNLGAGLFRIAHPDWSPELRWGLAVLTAFLFFGSILLHELAHALVARAEGVKVESITLFMFGGVARMTGEPPSPRAEFLIAGVGPLTSLLIGGLSLMLARALWGAEGPPVSDVLTGASALPPAATALMWLGSINIGLAVFNTIPGFPLDGGRLLRAILWRASGDLVRATRWASGVGRAFALFLILCGALMAFGARLPLFGAGPLQGVWLALIGWFLYSAAVSSYQRVVVTDVLRDVPVASVMRDDMITVPPQVSLRDAVDQYFMRTDQQCLPVVGPEGLVGLLCVPDLRKIDRSLWNTTTVAEVTRPTSELPVLGPNQDLAQALEMMASRELDLLPVADGGRLRGALRKSDIVRYLELQAV